MKLNTENKKNREMNNGRKEKHDLPGIQRPGTDEDCRTQSMRNQLQPKVQQTEQTVPSGYLRSWIPEHDPIKGDAR